MRSILTVMAIESVAPDVRTVAEVNNPRHADHFRRAQRRRAARLLAGRRAPAGPLGPLPGPDRARRRHRVRRRGLRALPGRKSPTTTSGCRSTRSAPSSGPIIDATLLSISRGRQGVRQPAVRLPDHGRRRRGGRGRVARHPGPTGDEARRERVAAGRGQAGPATAAAAESGCGRRSGSADVPPAPSASEPPRRPRRIDHPGDRDWVGLRIERGHDGATPAPIVPQALYQPPTSSQSGETTGSAVGIAAPPATASAMAPLVSVVSAPPAVVIPVVPLESSPAQIVSIVPSRRPGSADGKRPQAQEEARQALIASGPGQASFTAAYQTRSATSAMSSLIRENRRYSSRRPMTSRRSSTSSRPDIARR